MPAPIYYPSFTVRLGARFDEGLHGVKLTPTADAALSSLDPTIQVPLQQKRATSKDGLSFKTVLTPLRCTVEMPGYRAAGKFTMEVPFRDFPFEPDIVRALAVEVYAGAIPVTDWGRGNSMRGLRGLIPDDNPASPGFNQMLVGSADVIRVEHTDKTDVMHIEGRDLRGILLDIPAPLNFLRTLNTTKPIHEVVQQIVDACPALVRSLGSPSIEVRTQVDEWEGGVVPAPNDPTVMTRVNLGAVAAPATGDGAGVVPMPTGMNGQLKLWDLITNFCQFVGAVPYFVGRQLRIRPARALWDPRKLPGFDPRFPTPFAGGSPRSIKGTDGADHQTNVRVLAWGRNLSSLKRERKLGGVKVPTVIVTSVDTSSPKRGVAARHLEAQWPVPDPRSGVGVTQGKQARASFVSADGAVIQNQAIYVSVAGIRSKQRLQEIAKDIYEEVGRGELAGTCQTADLASLGGNDEDPDLLRLRPGDPVRFEVDNRGLASYPPPINSVSDLYRQDPETLAATLAERLGDADLGRVVAYSILGRIAERQTVYRASNVRFSWDKDKGVAIDFDFQNYIESRQGVTTARPKAKSNQNLPVAAVGHGGTAG